VPVWFDPRPRMMCGIGEILSAPLDLPPLPAVLVNPGVGVQTRDVFAALKLAPGQRLGEDDHAGAGLDPRMVSDRTALWPMLAQSGNDLERPAVVLQPVIAEVLE